MKIIYSDLSGAGRRQYPVFCGVGETARTIQSAESVSGFCILEISAAQIVVEASADNFSTLSYTKTFTPSNGFVFEDLQISPVTSASAWRVRALAEGHIGHFYVGTLKNLTNPTFPYAFEMVDVSEIRTSLGGQKFARLMYQRREGEFTFPYIPDDDIMHWRDLREKILKGLSFIFEDPITQIPYLVQGETLDIKLVQNGIHTAHLSIFETL